MVFLAPIWLLGLLPWAAAVVLLLRGKRERRAVPFLPLWQGTAVASQNQRANWLPTLPILLLVIATLFAILAAAGSSVALPGKWGVPVTIIVDTGRATPTGLSLTTVLNSVESSLLQTADHGQVDLISLPGNQVTNTDRAHWKSLATIRPSAFDTRAELERTISSISPRNTGPIIVITGQPIDVKREHITLIPVSKSVGNVSLVSISAREQLQAQLMIRVRNDSSLPTARLVVTVGGEDIEQTIDLPPTGAEKSYFVDLPANCEVVKVTLDVADDLPADNSAWLVRRRTWPRIEPGPGVPAEVGRIAEVYAKLRPPVESSRRIAVVDGLFNLPPLTPAIGLFSGDLKIPASQPRSHLRVVDHPVTAFVNWSLLTSKIAAPASPGEGWQSLVSIGNRVYVAIRTDPVRQIWCAIDSPEWVRSTDFVVFWTNAFDWVGESGNIFSATDTTAIRPGWERIDGPRDLEIGLYHLPDGTTTAVNAMNIVPTSTASGNWSETIFQQSGASVGRLSLRPHFLFLTLGTLVLIFLIPKQFWPLTNLRRLWRDVLE